MTAGAEWAPRQFGLQGSCSQPGARFPTPRPGIESRRGALPMALMMTVTLQTGRSSADGAGSSWWSPIPIS